MSNIITIEDLDRIEIQGVSSSGYEDSVTFFNKDIYDYVNIKIIKKYLAHNSLGNSNKYYEMYIAEFRGDYFLICRYGRVGNLSGMETIHSEHGIDTYSKFYSLRTSKSTKGYVEYSTDSYKKVIGKLHNLQK